MRQYTVAQVGLGNRGRIHADAFHRNADRFQQVALCDLDTARLAEGAAQYGVEATYTDAERMLAETRPDVFCFVTQPDLRLPMVALAAKYGVKALAFEKPMATSLREAYRIKQACDATVRVVTRTKVNRKNAKIYARYYPIFRGLYQSLKGDYKKIAAVVSDLS